MHFNLSELDKLPSRYRANLINSCSGYRPCNLLGTKSLKGVTNLGLFNSTMHIGSNPALLGFVLRPLTVRRDTYDNLKDTGVFTVNHVNGKIVSKSHKTSAKYAKEVSEFDEVQLTEEYLDGFGAPYVMESKIKIGCSYVNEYEIRENGCLIIIAAIENIYVPDDVILEDGWLNLETADSISNIGLDGYASSKIVQRYTYAKPDEELEIKDHGS